MKKLNLPFIKEFLSNAKMNILDKLKNPIFKKEFLSNAKVNILGKLKSPIFKKEFLSNVKMNILGKLKGPIFKKENFKDIKNIDIFKNFKNIDIFKKLPEKKYGQTLILKIRQLPRRLKEAACLLSITALVLSTSFTLQYLEIHKNAVFATDSYTITENGNELCKVRDKELLDITLSKLKNNLEKSNNHTIEIENKFDIEESKAKDDEIVSENELYEILGANVKFEIMAYAIDVDGKKIGVVNSEYEAMNVIEEVKDYFTKDYEEETILAVDTAENIEIKEVKILNNEIKNKTDLVNYIVKGTEEEKKYIVEQGDNYWNIAQYFNMSLDDLIKANPSSDPEHIQIGDEINLIVPKPFINVQVKRRLVQEEKTPYETEYKRVSYMYNDEEIIEVKGKAGLSKVDSIVTEQNGIQIAKEVLSEEVITPPTTQVVTTGTQDPPPKKGTGYFINPLPGATITSKFGSRSGFGFGGVHYGQDMAKASGSSIKAADGGVVTFAGWNGTYGYCVDIDHGGGFLTRYGHCSELYVSVGDKVYQGKVIAAVGSTGLSTGPHLHFEVRKYGEAVNPASYIGVQYR